MLRVDPLRPVTWSEVVRGGFPAALGALVVGLALVFWFALGGTDAPGGFTHDSAYITIVARNLLGGRGFVNDVLWFVPGGANALPMPHFNSNPGYPAAVAIMGKLAGGDLVRAGFLVNLIAYAACGAAVAVVLRRWGGGVAESSLVAGGSMLPVATFGPATLVLPDLAATAALALAVVGVDSRRWSPWLVGLAVAFAWLMRSTSMFAIPALLLLLCLATDSIRSRLVAIGSFIVAFGAAPVGVRLWKKAVFNTPVQGFESAFLVQDYVAHTRFGGDLGRFWASTTPPLGIGDLMPGEAVNLLQFTVGGLPDFARNLAGAMTGGSVLGFVGFFLAVAISLFEVRDRRLILVLGVGLAGFLGLFMWRVVSMELRYFLPFSVVGWVLVLRVLARRRFQDAGRLRWVGLSGSLVAFALAGPVQGIREARAHGHESVIVRAALNRCLPMYRAGARMVASFEPYYCGWAAGRSAVNLPSGAWQDVLPYFKRWQVDALVGPREVVTTFIPDLPVDSLVIYDAGFGDVRVDLSSYRSRGSR